MDEELPANSTILIVFHQGRSARIQMIYSLCKYTHENYLYAKILVAFWNLAETDQRDVILQFYFLPNMEEGAFPF